MTFNTKLDLKQNAWFIYENKVTCMPVESLTIKQNDSWHAPAITYGFRLFSDPGKQKFKDWLELRETEVFASKEELLKSL